MSPEVLKRVQERPFLPILLLLFVMLGLGWANSEFLTPYARPMMVGDAQGRYVFYDAASVDAAANPAFIYRESKDGKVWSREKRVTGRLYAAALTEDRIHLLFPGFLSSYDRPTLRRRATLAVEDLDFTPRHMEHRADGLILFGLDARRDLCAARITTAGDGPEPGSGLRATRLEARLEGAGRLPPKSSSSSDSDDPDKTRQGSAADKTSDGSSESAGAGAGAGGDDSRNANDAKDAKDVNDAKGADDAKDAKGARDAKDAKDAKASGGLPLLTSRLKRVDEIPRISEAPVVAWSSATVDSSTVLLFALGEPDLLGSRKSRRASSAERRQNPFRATDRPGLLSGTMRKTIRWTRFSPAGFTTLNVYPEKLITATLVREGDTVVLYGVRKPADSTIVRAELRGDAFVPTGELTFPRGGGVFKHHGCSALAGLASGDSRTLLAQIGGTIRLVDVPAPKEDDWLMMAQLPTEERTLVYGWFVIVLMLTGLLILSGLQSYRRRREGLAGIGDAPLDLQSLLEEGVAREAARQARQSESSDSAERDSAERDSADRDAGAPRDASSAAAEQASQAAGAAAADAPETRSDASAESDSGDAGSPAAAPLTSPDPRADESDDDTGSDSDAPGPGGASGSEAAASEVDELARGEAEDSEEARETAGSGRLARFEPPPGTRDATIFERAAAFGLDLFALFLIFTSLSPLLPLGLVNRIRDSHTSGDVVKVLQDVYIRLLGGQSLAASELVVLAAVQLLLGLAYFTLLERTLGGTIGKLLIGLEVRNLAGDQPDLLQIFLRNVFRIEFFAGLLGPISIFVSIPTMVLTRRTQRPGDLVAHTVVLRRS